MNHALNFYPPQVLPVAQLLLVEPGDLSQLGMNSDFAAATRVEALSATSARYFSKVSPDEVEANMTSSTLSR